MAPQLDRFARRLVAFEDQTDPPVDGDFIIPEDLSALSDEELGALHEEAVHHFDDLFGDGGGLSDADLAALAILTEGIETLLAESSTRAAHAQERVEAATVLAERAHPKAADEPADEADDKEGDEDDDKTDVAPEVIPEVEAEAPLPIAASGRQEYRVNLNSLRSRQSYAPRPAAEKVTSIKDVLLAAGEGSGYSQGQGIDWLDLGKIVDRRLGNFNANKYQAAHAAGHQLRQQHSIATIRKPFDPRLVLESNDPQHVDEVLRFAMDEHRLPGGSLLAAGGWCAPSEVIYDLFEMESRDGLVSVPEIGVTRGGIRWTVGPLFSDIYADTGFTYTEADDQVGDYDGNGGGAKPVYQVTCPEFEEERLNLSGLIISAGLLQQRGYPEVIARTTRGALVAHDHKISANVIGAMVTGSTAVTMTTGQVGAVAPLLDSIEKQVEHYRASTRLARGTTLEAVFPYWIHGVVRSDLSRRSGTDLNPLDVTDAQIDAWFALRGIRPQYVYDWQPIDTTAAGDFKSWPATVQFLLYVAGTWVKGGSDIITLDTIYDSVLLGNNDFTALFTEEGWLMAKLGPDSRVITVALCPNGAASAPIVLACDSTSATPPDSVDPVVGTLVASALANTTFTLTVTGASDVGGLDAEPYRVSTDGGVTWSQWQTSAVFLETGKTAETTYYCRHEVRDALGNTTTGAVISALTTNV